MFLNFFQHKVQVFWIAKVQVKFSGFIVAIDEYGHFFPRPILTGYFKDWINQPNLMLQPPRLRIQTNQNKDKRTDFLGVEYTFFIQYDFPRFPVTQASENSYACGLGWKKEMYVTREKEYAFYNRCPQPFDFPIS
jgi:hypothetical protein